MQYFTESDLESYLVKIKPNKLFEQEEDEIQREIDIPPSQVSDKFTNNAVNAEVIITKTFKAAVIPEDIYNAYNNNLTNSKENLILFLENSKEEPLLEIEIKKTDTQEQ